MAKTLQYRAGKSPLRIRRVMQAAGKSSFATVEDSPHAVQTIHKLAGVAVRKAAWENRRHGLAAVIIRNGQVIKLEQGEKEKVIATIENGSRKYKPGQVFYARKG